MPEPTADQRVELTDEQKKAVEEAYGYRDDAEITEEDLELARKMFDAPAKFRLLRKILGVYTREERGMTFKSTEALVQADMTDLHAYGTQMAVTTLADERVRHALLTFYVRLQKSIQGEMKAGFEAQNRRDFEEDQRRKEFEEERAGKERTVGENL